MISDSELLRQYAREGNDPAFTEIVHRYTDLVYSAALRMVAGDTHLAEDVAQRVFSILASQAGALSARAGIVGWLYTTTHHTASVVVRAERRRRTREQIALAMNDEPAAPAVDWSRLQPLLDEEVYRLNAADREAVLLRFFQGKSHREVGTVLGVSEDLARKRVERAIEKLRAAFLRRGLGISSAALADSLTAFSVQTAPTGLASNLAKLSLTNVGQAGLVASAWSAFIFTMKTKIIAIAALLLLGLLIFGAWRWRDSSFTDGQKLPAASSGIISSVSPPDPASANANSASGPSRTGLVESPSLPAVAAAASSTAAPIANASGDLNVTIQDVLQLARSGDYIALVRNYSPPKDLRSPNQTLEQVIQNRASDPAFQKMLQSFADTLAIIKDTTPVFNADGHSARLLTPDGGTALVFTQIDSTWRIAGIEKQKAPLSASDSSPSMTSGTKKAPVAGAGGYVP